MGYSYCGGLLCCDVCDHAGLVRKYSCPFGYCQAVALCPDCRRKHPEYVSKAEHRKRGCEKYHNAFVLQEQRRAALLQAGEVVRCSALWHPKRPELNVKVIFQGADHQSQAFWMSQETYRAIPLTYNATPEDFRKHGKIVEARTLGIYDAEMEPAGVAELVYK